MCVCSFRYPPRMRHTLICGLLCSTKFVHIISQRARFKKKLLTIKCVLVFLYNVRLRHFSFLEELSEISSKSTRYFCPILMKLEFSRQIFEEYSYFKFHEDTPFGRRDVLRGPTDMTLIVAFRNFAKEPKKPRSRFFTARYEPCF